MSHRHPRGPLPSFRALAALAAAAVLAPAAGAQGNFNATIGPNPAPIGSPISITVSNDAPFLGSSTFCPYRILDGEMNEVYDPGCPDNPGLIGPYGWVTATWDQRDQLGEQVPAGFYWVEVSYDIGGPTVHPLVLGGTDAGLVFEGTATIGQNFSGTPRNFSLTAPLDGGYPYFLVASVTAETGVSTCAGTFPLDPDLLLGLTLTPNTLFLNSLGFLDENGNSKAPTFPLNEDPTLVGISIHAAYVVLDLEQACQARRISEPYPLTIIS